MPDHFKDYYDILEVPFAATDAEIKTAYRKLARELHPDMHPDEAEHFTAKFQQVSEAYEVLSDPDKKLTYDYRYRQLVLLEGPQFEYVGDTAPPDNRKYQHKYTYRNKRTFSFASVAALAVLLFMVGKMLISAAPIDAGNRFDQTYPLPSSYQPSGVQQGSGMPAVDSTMDPFSNAPFIDRQIRR